MMEKKKTGAGESVLLILTANEERLLKLMGNKAVEGDIGIPEVGGTKRKSAVSFNY